MPASWSTSQVPEVAKSSMPISSKPRAMPTISCLSSSLTVMMIRPPRLGAFRPAPLEGLQQSLREGLGQAQHLAGGLHLRAQAGVHVSELSKEKPGL